MRCEVVTDHVLVCKVNAHHRLWIATGSVDICQLLEHGADIQLDTDVLAQWWASGPQHLPIVIRPRAEESDDEITG
jgi:hypothetical protein